ncbi:MAG: C39 family peptidase [Anaerolineae bacterium]|nr:C39 family peptidase [Anaerolineae bacterium]
MTTPYDNQLLLVQWRAKVTPGTSIADFATKLRQNVPNATGVLLKVTDGNQWMIDFDDVSDPMAISGPERIAKWVSTLAQHNLGVHVWAVPNGREAGTGRDILAEETDMLIRAASVAGVKSLVLDLEVESPRAGGGPFARPFWKGNPAEAAVYMQRLRAGLPGMHIGFCLDARRPNEFAQRVEPFLAGIDSFHPQTYPILFRRPVEDVMREAFNNLRRYNKPIVPMIQGSYDAPRRPSADEIARQADFARVLGAPGLSIWRLGVDRQPDGNKCMDTNEYRAIAALPWPRPDSAVASPSASFTWQDLFNALAIVAKINATSWSTWFDASGAAAFFVNTPQKRQSLYNGPQVESWPITIAIRNAILHILTRYDSRGIAQLWEQVKSGVVDEAKFRRAPGSSIGIHGAPGVGAPPNDRWEWWIGTLKDIGAKWYKQLDDGDINQLQVLAWCKRLKKAGIEPIVRFYVANQFPNSLPESYFEKMKLYAAAGIKWAEIGSEPVLSSEWQPAWQERINQLGHDDPEVIPALAQAWITDAKKTVAAGMFPAFYALGTNVFNNEVDAPWSTVRFAQKLSKYLADHFRQDTLDIFRHGGWIAVHVATYGKPPEFDPHSGAGGFWDMCLRGYEIVTESFAQAFGNDLKVNDIPIMSTEGGVFTPNSLAWIGHDRPLTEAEHAARAIEMFRWVDKNSPLSAMCPWCLSVGDLIGHFDSQWQADGWIEQTPQHQLRPLPVIEAMHQLRREFESLNQPKSLRLMLPYHSQWDATASSHSGDCGPTCVAMVLNTGRAVQQFITVDQIYANYLPNKAFGEFTAVWEMELIGQRASLPFNRIQYANEHEATKGIREALDQKHPSILLIHYEPLRGLTDQTFTGGHFVVAVGYTADENGTTTGFFVHDPLPRAETQKGVYLYLSVAQLMKACGTCHLDGNNPNFLVLISSKVAESKSVLTTANHNHRYKLQPSGWDKKMWKLPAGAEIAAIVKLSR